MTDINRICIRCPDDWHVHLRDDSILEMVAKFTAAQFARAVIMPNLDQPITTKQSAIDYRNRIQRAVKKTPEFKPLMTCYLTENINIEEIKSGFELEIFLAAKLYPAHATTNSSYGITDVTRLYHIFQIMEKIGMPLLIHGEMTDPSIDIFDREAKFIEKVLIDIVKNFPSLKIVFEHITTLEAVHFINSASDNIAATITPHHLIINRNAMFDGGFRPHNYCLPIAKREKHRKALRKAATSGSSKYFLGTDSAPHKVHDKEAKCGCAGIFNAPFAIESYTMVFDEELALDKLELFASINGPNFYGLPINQNYIELIRAETIVSSTYKVDDTYIVPFLAGEKIKWKYQRIAQS